MLTYLKNINIMNISIITLNRNDLYFTIIYIPIKRQRLPVWMKKQDPLQAATEYTLKYKDKDKLKIKGWKKIILCQH